MAKDWRTLTVLSRMPKKLPKVPDKIGGETVRSSQLICLKAIRCKWIAEKLDKDGSTDCSL